MEQKINRYYPSDYKRGVVYIQCRIGGSRRLRTQPQGRWGGSNNGCATFCYARTTQCTHLANWDHVHDDHKIWVNKNDTISLYPLQHTHTTLFLQDVGVHARWISGKHEMVRQGIRRGWTLYSPLRNRGISGCHRGSQTHLPFRVSQKFPSRPSVDRRDSCCTKGVAVKGFSHPFSFLDIFSHSYCDSETCLYKTILRDGSSHNIRQLMLRHAVLLSILREVW